MRRKKIEAMALLLCMKDCLVMMIMLARVIVGAFTLGRWGKFPFLSLYFKKKYDKITTVANSICSKL